MEDYTAPERGRAALLTINGQRDFTLPGSTLKACGVGRALPAMRALVRAFRDRSAPVFHAVRLYRPDGSNVDIFRRSAVEEGLRVLMPGTFGAELVDEIRPDSHVRLDPERLLDGRFQEIGPKEWVFYKPRWGAFHKTTLAARLQALDVSTLVVCGCNFSTSGRATVYEAGARDFRVILVTDALSGSCEESVCELGRIGVYLMNAGTCLDWLTGTHRTHAA
ncbi:MAG: cysteine hydrolase family protein [Planctomycetota bacterium]|jgi:nicotinamidase-related amidase